MKKVITAILIAVMLLTLLVGCGTTSSGNSTQAPSSGSATQAPSSAGTSSTPVDPNAATVENPHIWKTGTSAGLVDGHHVIYDLLVKCKEEIEAATGGRYILETYHSSQLGSDRDMLEGTVMGTYEFAVVPGTFVSAYVDDFNVFEFPYLFRDYDHFFDTMESDVAREIGSEVEDYGLVWLANGLNGFLSVSNSAHDIRTLDDFKGLKLRCIDSPIQVGAVNLLGATGTVVNWGETYTALQQHTIDGVITTCSGFYTGKINEVNNYFTSINMFYTPITCVMNQDYWNSLPEEDQVLIRDAVERAFAWHRETAYDDNLAHLKLFLETCPSGPITEVTYDEFDHEAAAAAMAPLYEEYDSKYGDYFDAIKAIGQ